MNTHHIYLRFSSSFKAEFKNHCEIWQLILKDKYTEEYGMNGYYMTKA